MENSRSRPPEPKPTATKSIQLRVIVLQPPKPRANETGFGLQDNSSGDWILHHGQKFPNGDVHFTCECRVKPDAKSGAPNFLGPFVHGPPAQRFLYLSWKPKQWQPGDSEIVAPPYTRRLKVRLSSITWQLIEAARRAEAALEVTVAGTGKDGGPACASVPLLNGGWKVGSK